MKTQRYRQQHEDILAIAATISDKLNHEAISKDANGKKTMSFIKLLMS
ncbi:MAG: hypothetical protein JEZ14_02775 [Marinilabiliaceae bacterium]|nr:hypothetical protein [Marinilabiliaceae bacterium]